MRLIRVFPQRTRATPTDDLVRFGPPGLFDEADEVHVSVTFKYDKPRAEHLAEQWRAVTSNVKIHGPAYDNEDLTFIPGRYIRPGYTITSRGCPRRCWFCGVWKKWPVVNPMTIYDGWNILDDNLLAAPRAHVEAVFDMLRRQKPEHWPKSGRGGKPWDGRIEFTGGLEALALEDYQVDLLASLTPRPNMFWAYDPGDTFDTLESAARRMLAAGFTRESHRLRVYVLMGYPKDTFDLAEKRLRDMLAIGMTPFAMLWRPDPGAQEKHRPGPEWKGFARKWARPTIIHASEQVTT